MWDRRAQIPLDRVHDGDTIYDVVLDQGFRDNKQVDVRLLGVYAPETHEVGGPECRDFVVAWLKDNAAPVKWPFVVITARMKVADKEQKTLDRYAGTVTSLDGTRNLNAEIIQFIHDKGYSGGIGS